MQQIERPELDHGTDLGHDPPALADLREVLDQQLDRQAALHFETAVEAGLGLFQRLGRNVGGEDFDAPAGEAAVKLLEVHGKRIGLLAGRGGGAPDAHPPLRGARSPPPRPPRIAELLERNLVAKEKRFVGHHRFDHLDHERVGVGPPQALHQLGQAGEAGLTHQRQKPALDQVLLVGRQHETRAVLQQLAEIIVLVRGHTLLPEKSRTIFGAICSIGRTDEHSPACVTDPGMPQTTLVASSWAITAPPASTTSDAPCVPSEPMPVRTTARHFGPHTCAAEENRGSTEGLQKLMRAPSSSEIVGSPSRRTPRRWRPPGATEMRRARTGSPCDASRVSRPLTRARCSASTMVKVGGMCWTRSTGASSMTPLRRARITLSACGPPVDDPT